MSWDVGLNIGGRFAGAIVADFERERPDLEDVEGLDQDVYELATNTR